MRKSIISPVQQDSTPLGQEWLNLEQIAEVEISSEDAAHPIESALLPGQGSGWRAAGPGTQTIRLVFAHPQSLQRIWLNFIERQTERTQEYVLRWSPDGGHTFHDIVRQQWNFSPEGANTQTEDRRVDLPAVTVLELIIRPGTTGGDAVASLDKLRLA